MLFNPATAAPECVVDVVAVRSMDHGCWSSVANFNLPDAKDG